MVLFMGLDTVRKSGVIGLFNQQWGNITDGNTYQIQYRFGRRRWSWLTTGATTRLGKGYYAENLKMKFLHDIARYGSMEIRRSKRRFGLFSLRGPRNALNATVGCQMAVLRKQQTIAGRKRRENQRQE